MRRLVCLLLIVLICCTCYSIIRTLEQSNALYDEVSKQELSYEYIRRAQADEVEKVKSDSNDKVQVLESYKEWNKEIQDYMQ